MEQPQRKKKRKSKEHYTKDALLAKKRKVFQNAKVIQKFRKVREQEIVKEREQQQRSTSAKVNDGTVSKGRVGIYEQVFAATNDAETQLVGNLKGRDRRYQDKQKQKKQYHQQQQHRPNPYKKVLNNKQREERETKEEFDARKKKLNDGIHRRKKDAKKLKRRSRRGQPVMENHIDTILAKLQAERR